MKLLIIMIIHFYVALLPLIIHGVSGRADDDISGSIINMTPVNDDEMFDEVDMLVVLNYARTRIDDIKTNGGNINNKFIPSDYLGQDESCIFYKGELIPDGETVVMKFGPSRQSEISHEYEIYSYMNAIDNPAVERYGIPAVYYYGSWDAYDMIAVTFLDSRFHQIQKDIIRTGTDWNVVDIFIIIREYVRISKYMHSRGICHGYNSPKNMMFRGNKGFLINFYEASKVTTWTAINRDCRKADWRHFLYHLCKMCKLHDKRINELEDGGLKTVLSNFYNYAHSAGRVEYNEMHNLITEVIRQESVPEPAMVSWLSDEEKHQALAEGTLDIQSIDDPYPITPFRYDPPNRGHFVNGH